MILNLNPFEEEEIAKEWIVFIENNDESLYVNELFPAIKSWGAKQQGKLLDIGCGQGTSVHQLMPDGSIQYYGVEPSSYLLARAQELFKEYNWCTFQAGSFSALPYVDDYFDAAMSCNVLSHVSDLEVSITEMVRVLKVGASVLLISLNPAQNDFWLDRYHNATRIDDGIMGTVVTEKSALHKNTFYPHTEYEWNRVLQKNKLSIVTRKTYGHVDVSTEGIFMALECVVSA